LVDPQHAAPPGAGPEPAVIFVSAAPALRANIKILIYACAQILSFILFIDSASSIIYNKVPEMICVFETEKELSGDLSVGQVDFEELLDEMRL